jgi:hypothetical protein
MRKIGASMNKKTEEMFSLMFIRLIQENERTKFLNDATVDVLEKKYNYKLRRKKYGK